MVKTQIWIALILYLLLWKMYHKHTDKYNEFINFIRYFKARLFFPDKNICLSKWGKKRSDPGQLNLFKKKNIA